MQLFSLTIFTSALALFWIQPLFTRLILPMFGGSPAVWTTAVLFFQTALLVGYIYAHVLSARLSIARQVILHVLILILGLLALPVSFKSGINPVEWVDWPPVRLLGLMTVSIGLPFVVVSATAPCLQRWFSSTSHRYASDPYFLYAASNAGSIAALLSYPLIVEPLAGLSRQAELWGWLYASLALLVALCGWWTVRTAAPQGRTVAGAAEAGASWTQRGRWILLSAVPSALLHATTLHITTDIASAPWIWVLPLTLYLLTFVIVFARRQFIGQRPVQRILVPAAVIASIPTFVLPAFWLLGLALALGTFFCLALACHQRLASERPGAGRLTEYYVLMALGGGLGGVAATIVAPLVLDRQAEYPILMAAALLCLPAGAGGLRRGWMSLLAIAVVFATAWPTALAIDPSFVAPPFLAVIAATLVTGVCAKNHPHRLAGLLAGAYIGLNLAMGENVLARERSFFGIYVVKERSRDDTRVRELKHGTTSHGRQALEHALAREPLSYYHRGGPLGDLMQALGTGAEGHHNLVIGLGTGAALCYALPGQRWTVIEIDPAVVQIARDSGLFTYARQCTPRARIVVGDGRVALRAIPPGSVDVMIIDAFTSDAIPVHLLTRDAFEEYFGRLTEDGLLLVHISNRIIDLEPVIGKIARDLDVAARISRGGEREETHLYNFSVWALLARNQKHIDALPLSLSWQPLEAGGDGAVWTDDYTNMLPYLMWRPGNRK